MIKKCFKCGSVVKLLNNDSQITCCGEFMKELIPNSVDASFEKHVPNYEIKYKRILITVDHVMEKDHYIEWIMIENDKEFYIKKLTPGEKAEAEFDLIDNATIYAYCNKHNLWKKEVE